MIALAQRRKTAEAHRIDWLAVNNCPACATPTPEAVRLPESGYVFGDECIDFPEGGISLATCPTCSLVFKTVLPDPHSLAAVFERQAGNKWMEPYDFHSESVELQRLGGPHCDLLDVGSGNGGMLKAWAQWSVSGRRSALDVVHHPGGGDHVRGEFITGLIDSEPLQWSGHPYDVVTLFDVLEHLYAPTIAFSNLRSLLQNDGLLVIETGNVASEWPLRYGPNHWWYARLFEHHVFWSRRSLEAIAERFGFRLLVWREVRHKTRVTFSPFRKLNDSAQVALYRLTPTLYPKLAPLLGKHWTQPWSPFVHDHFRAVLRKL